MHPSVARAVADLLQHRNLTADTTRDCIAAIMDGECEPVDIAAFLTAKACGTVTPEELIGAATAMRQRASTIRTGISGLLDTCGTGGDQLHTFNISTAAAIVAAACGVPVAKHGNRSVSSSSGSADVLETLGVNLNLSVGQVGECLNATGIAFCFAPLVHGAMKHAAPIRRRLGFPTLFNFLGPLTNPAGAACQVIGASSTAAAELLAAAIHGLGTRRSLVVCGNNELDEVCLWGQTAVFVVSDKGIERETWCAADLELPECEAAALRVSSPQESAEVIRELLQFSGPEAAVNMVIANTAAALMAAGRHTRPAEAARVAAATIRSGAAFEKLQQLIAWTQRQPAAGA